MIDGNSADFGIAQDLLQEAKGSLDVETRRTLERAARKYFYRAIGMELGEQGRVDRQVLRHLPGE